MPGTSPGAERTPGSATTTCRRRGSSSTGTGSSSYRWTRRQPARCTTRRCRRKCSSRRNSARCAARSSARWPSRRTSARWRNKRPRRRPRRCNTIRRLRAWWEKGSGTFVRSTLRAVPAKVPDPFSHHARKRPRNAAMFAGAGRVILTLLTLPYWVVFVVLWGASAAHYFLVVLEQTSAGGDRIHWPDDRFLDRLWKVFYLSILLAIWLAPVVLIFQLLDL